MESVYQAEDSVGTPECYFSISKGGEARHPTSENRGPEATQP